MLDDLHGRGHEGYHVWEDPSCAAARGDSESGSTIPGNCPTPGSGQCACVTRLCDVTLAHVQSMLFYDGYRRTYYLIEHKFKRAMSN